MSEQEEPKVVIGNCTFAGIEIATVFDIFSLVETGAFYGIVNTQGTLLPDARNTLLNSVYERFPEFTHLLFIDSDMNGINPDLVKILFDQDKDIISPLAVRRHPPFKPAFSFYKESSVSNYKELGAVFELSTENRPIIRVRGTGLGCCLIKRKVFDYCGESVGTRKIWFTNDREERYNISGEKEQTISELREKEFDDPIKESFDAGYELGRDAHHNAEFKGEDIAFCLSAERKGFKSWVHTGLYIGHIGQVAYDIRDWIDIIQNKEQNLRLDYKSYVWRPKEKKEIKLIKRPGELDGYDGN